MTEASSHAPLFLLAIAALGWYASSRASADALAGANAAPGRRALGHLLPGAVVAIAAVILGMPEIVMGVVFGSSVAAMTLVLGIATLAWGVSRSSVDTGQSESGRKVEPLPPRVWRFLLPVTLIALFIGFSGNIGWVGVVILAVQGMVLLLVRNQPASEPNSLNRRHWIQLIAAIVAAVVAAWAGIRAARDISNNLGQSGCGFVTALMIAPALVLSMISAGSTLVHEGRFDQAVTIQISFVLLNLCGLLPLTAALWLTGPSWRPPMHAVVATYFAKTVAPTTAPSTTSASDATADDATAMPTNLPYPMAAWRVDAVLLVAVGLLLLPVTLGRWSLGVGESLALVLAYAFYMLMTTVMAH